MSFGDRVQYSVFVIDLRPASLVRLRADLARLMVAAVDSILLVDLGPVASLTSARFNYLGRQRPITPSGPIVIRPQQARRNNRDSGTDLQGHKGPAGVRLLATP